MQLFAYSPVGQADEFLVWVGLLDVPIPPPIAFEIAGCAVQPRAQPVAFEPLGDDVCDSAGRPLNHRAIFSLPWPDTPERFTLEVIAGDQRVSLTCKQLPNQLPDKSQPSFNLLLSSCYYQPNDRTLALADVVKTLKPAADFTLLAGDQVYLDLPSQQNLPRDKYKLARALGKKYQINWFSTPLQQPGLAGLLAHGPVLCVPDDHEFWNNFPLFQVQLDNTHRQGDRDTWRSVATRLYERYQMSPAQRDGFFRRDIDPLSMLFLDSRSSRDAEGTHMFTSAARHAIQQWKNDLLACKKNRQPCVGLLSSGQALVIEKPGVWDRHLADMEMINYRDFEWLRNTLFELFMAEVPVLYITGDVHWGRILEGKNLRGKTLFYEVIASPSRLIDTLGSDQIKLAKNSLRDWLGSPKPFPRHPEAPGHIPDIKLANIHMAIKHQQVGDHVAMLRFQATPGGVEFYVDYVCTDADDKKRRAHSSSQGPFKLMSF